MSKVHGPIFDGLVHTLEVIFSQGHHADKVIERAFKANRRWGSRDRKIFAESVYEIVRWKRSLEAIYLQLGGEAENSYENWAEIWFAAFQDEHELTSRWSERRGEILKTYKNLSPGEKESFPDWMVEIFESQFGPKLNSVLKSLNDKPPVFLRVNLLKTTALALAQDLEAQGFLVKVVGDETLVLIERKSVFSSESFQKGHFEIQDLSSQRVTDRLDPKPGEFVIDACAGAGGKSLHIASRMKNKGRILSLDIQEKKLLELKKRVRRAGIDNLEAKWIESSKTIKRMKGKADRLLLDVPCTGVGVLRRNPDAKWKLSLEKLRELEGIQAEILSQYSEMLKPGGLLVYSTCSIFRSENEDQVKKFLSQNDKFELLGEETLLPEDGGGDGFYIAWLKSGKSKN